MTCMPITSLSAIPTIWRRGWNSWPILVPFVVSAHTHRLTDGYFAFKDLGPTQIKGVEETLSIYEVLSVGPVRTRLQVSARRGLTRFVGRQREMEQLQRALDHA